MTRSCLRLVQQIAIAMVLAALTSHGLSIAVAAEQAVPAPTLTSAPAAMVLEVRGKVQTIHGNGQTQPLLRMMMLRPGARLVTEADAFVKLVFLADMHYETLKSGEVVIGPLGSEPGRAVERLDVPELRNKVSYRKLQLESRPAAGVMRTDLNGVPLPIVAPMRGSTVATLRPSLSWPSKTEGATFEVSIDVAGKNQLAWQATTTASSLRVPEENALMPSRHYQWRVSIHDPDGPTLVAEGDFRTPTQAEVAELKELEESIVANDLDRLLLVAMCYEKYGVADDALRVFEQARKLDADDPAISAVCAQLQFRAGNAAEAKKLWEAAERRGWKGSAPHK